MSFDERTERRMISVESVLDAHGLDTSPHLVDSLVRLLAEEWDRALIDTAPEVPV